MTGIMESQKTSVARQRLGKHVPAATNREAAIGILLDTMFSIRSVQIGYKRRELRFGSSGKYKRLELGGGQAYDRSSD
jgi:hypothetical protein